MNGIDRRSQKVECIIEFELRTRAGAVYPGPSPVLGETYTVDDFVDTGMVLDVAETLEGDVRAGITLLEVPPIRSKCGRVFGWPIIGFRPLISRAADIGALTGIARAARQTEPA